MQQHTLDNQNVDVQSAASVNVPQMQHQQQLQVMSPVRTGVDLSGTAHQGILYQEAMQNIQNLQSFSSQANSLNAQQQQMTDWTSDGRFVQAPVRYSSTLQPVYDFRGQLLAPGNLALHPANVNQIVQYTYGQPQQRPSHGSVAQFTPWQTIFTPNQGFTWVPGGIQATTIEGQGNQILTRNIQHDPQPGIFIQNGQAQLQQFKQMDGQHASIPKTAFTENFSPTLPNSVGTVNNMRTQQQAQMQAFQTMLQSQKANAKVLAKNSFRLTSSSINGQKNGAYHTNSAKSPAHQLPPVHANTPGQITRTAASSSPQESKRMKQCQAPEESSRKELGPVQQVQKRSQQLQGSPVSVPISVNNGVPATHEVATLPVTQASHLQRNIIREPVTSASRTIQILPGTSVAQGTLKNSFPAVTSQQQLENQGDAEQKKRTQQPRSPTAEPHRSEEPHGSLRDLGKYMKENSNLKQKALAEVEEIYNEDVDVYPRNEKDGSGATLSKATVLVKPQIMSHTVDGSFESISTNGDCEIPQMKSEDDRKVYEDDDKGLDGKPSADSGKDGSVSLNKQQTKPNLSKWTVADVYEFIRTVPGCSEYAEDFVSHDIDGEALMLLKTDHLVTAMSMTLGPAMKIISRIDAMREDTGSPAQ